MSTFLKRRNLIDVILPFLKKYCSTVKKLILVLVYFIHNRNYNSTVQESSGTFLIKIENEKLK